MYSSFDGRDKFATESFTTEDLEVRCYLCGKVISEPNIVRNRFKNQWICDECRSFKEKETKKPAPAEEGDVVRQQKAKFLDYIKKIFGIKEIPDWWMEQLRKMLVDNPNKTYNTLTYTAYYAVEIEGFVPKYEYGLSFIPLFFERAKAFLDSRRAVKKANKTVELTNTVDEVTIMKPVSRRHRPLTDISKL